MRYIHDPAPMTIGNKRNALCQAATGDVIVHFDDDDYYGPLYIEAMLNLMTTAKADIVKLYGFHLYHQKSGTFAYWDLEHGFPLHYVMHPHHANFNLGQKPQGPREAWGYGFSYVYKKEVWEKIGFEDVNHGEDQTFADAATLTFPHAGMQDRTFLMVHVMHDSNTSIAYPQQLLPNDLRAAYFPGFTPPRTAGSP